MTREEIIKQGAPIEPNCFETVREEQWYKVGLFEGATSNPWHSVADGDLPTKDGEYLVLVFGGTDFFHYHVESNYWSKSRVSFYKDWCAQDRITHWMEIPQIPKKGGEKKN